MRLNFHKLLGTVAFAALIAPLPAFAQSATTQPADNNQLEQIVVTAQKRSENLQTVPVSVSAFTSAALEARGVNSVLDIAGITPSLSLPVNNGVVLPFLRGIGNPANAPGNEGSVAVYVDGVYFTRLSSGFFSLNNIDRVEVLKGPQGTLFGRNSSGGVIQIVTSEPSRDTHVKAHIGYGAYNTLQGDFYLTTGLGDNAAFDVSMAGRKQYDGYGTNLATGNKTNYHDDMTVRSKLLVEPSDQTKILLSGFYSYSKSSVQGSTVPGTSQGFQTAPFLKATPTAFYDQNMDFDPASRQEAWGVSLKFDQNLGFAQFASITAYMHEKERQSFDIDYGPRPDVAAEFPVDLRQFTQEFQLSNPEGSQLKWILGLFYYDARTKIDALTFEGAQFFPGDILGDNILNQIKSVGQQHAKSYAAYAQATYEILPKLKLTGGIRYTNDKLNGSGSTTITVNNVVTSVTRPADGNVSYNKVTFRAALDYELADHVMAFASFSRGYKSGVFNLLGFNPNAALPEVVDAYEIGIKSELFDRRLRLNISGFWDDITNPQVQLLAKDTTVLSNAQASRVNGVEFEGSLRAAPGLTIDFGAVYLDAKYRRYLGAPNVLINPNPPYGSIKPFGSIDASRNRTPLAPKFTAHVGAQYSFETKIGRFNLSADYNYNDGYYFEPNNFLRQNAYHMVNSQLTYKPDDKWSFSVWTRNLANEKIISFAASQAGAAGYPFIPMPPRTWGVTAGVSF